MTDYQQAQIEAAAKEINIWFPKYDISSCRSIAEKALAAADAIPAWQPIETAPQNSINVLVCFNNGLGAIMIACTPGTGQWWGPYMNKISTPTHWMHLPAAPMPEQEDV